MYGEPVDKATIGLVRDPNGDILVKFYERTAGVKHSFDEPLRTEISKGIQDFWTVVDNFELLHHIRLQNK
jgi:hypothetical protein